MTKNIFEEIKKINPWWESNQFRFDVINRKHYIKNLLKKDNDRLIDVLIGPRRVGKTSIMHIIINKLLDRGISRKRIIYLTSELRTIQENLLDKTIEGLREEFGFDYNNKLYIFIDEVQDINDWQRSIKLQYDTANVKFFLTGSSSLILKPETSKLTGRFILHEVLPLSFSEWLIFKKHTLNKVQTAKNIQLAENYLQSGGYPEYVLSGNKLQLNDTIESTLYRDLLSVYGIRNPKFLQDLLDYLADKVTNDVSANRIRKDLNVNDKTARFYLDYLQDVYLIYPLYLKSSSHRITKSSVPKYYFNDTGILALRSLNPKIGQLAENAVYVHLRRMSQSVEYPQIFYDRIEDQEVDFSFSRKQELFEVKYRNHLSDKSLEKYDFGKKITFIVPDEKTVQDSLKLFNPNFKFVSLWKFLSSNEV